MTRRSGDVSTPPDTSPARCFPSKPADGCRLCWRSGCVMPRHGVVIDASAIVPAESCALFVSDHLLMRRAA